MSDLATDQARFVAVLQNGPSAFPDGLFSGDIDRVMLGLKAHANTISHARLIALEQTFPRTMAHIGHARFNLLSREFVELPKVRPCKLMDIGQGFSAFLATHAEDRLAADLAAIEWAWLESYHAGDAPTLQLSDLAYYDEPGLLAMPIALHPATRTVAVLPDVAGLLPELGKSQMPVAAMLVTRPDNHVQLQPLDAAHFAVAQLAQNIRVMSNLLQAAIEALGEADALPVIFALIQAGALTKPGS